MLFFFKKRIRYAVFSHEINDSEKPVPNQAKTSFLIMTKDDLGQVTQADCDLEGFYMILNVLFRLKNLGTQGGGKVDVRHYKYILKCLLTSQVTGQNQPDLGSDSLSRSVLLCLWAEARGSEPATPPLAALHSPTRLLVWCVLF